jgi:CubicO group peptidase (beta-lactamase class C family)
MITPKRLVTPLAAAVVVLAFVLGGAVGCGTPTPKPRSTPAASTSASVDPAQSATVDQVVRDVMASQHLQAAIVKVSVGGREVITKAYGESMPGVPATTDMHFRNGAVAISYVSILLLQLVDEGTVKLDDKVSRWLPDLKYADQVTLGQLAQMTSGYVDYVTAPELTELLYANPFRTFTPEDLIAISIKRPLLYRPGTNWNYAHTNYVILGLALEKITGKRMTRLLAERVLGPLGLDNTTDPGTPAITEPALHAYSSERRYALKIPASIPFTEDVTFWNPSWTITHGAIQTTNIDDMHTSAVAIGTGRLLKPATFRQMITKDLIGRTTSVKGCLTCFPQQPAYTYGLGIVSSGNWLVQDPLFAGESGAIAYLPSQQVAIAVAVTYEPAAYTSPASPKNSADFLWRKIASELAPADAPVIPPDAQ